MVLSDTLIHKCNMSQTKYNYILLHLIFLQHGYISISFCSKKRMWLCHHIHWLLCCSCKISFFPCQVSYNFFHQNVENLSHTGNRSWRTLCQFTQWFLNMVSNAPLTHLPPTYILVCTCARDTFPAWYCVDMQVEWWHWPPVLKVASVLERKWS